MWGEWNIWVIALITLMGYLFGNFQTAVILSKVYFHDDIRRHGSGNAGSTNMLRVYGKLFGLLTLAGDALKCIGAILLGQWIGWALGLNTDPSLAKAMGGYIAGLMVVFGHCYPVFFGFKGGKGAASALAYMWMLFPLSAMFTTICGLIILLFSKRVSFVSIMGAILFSMFSGILTLVPRFHQPYLIYFAVGVSLIVLLRHIPNIRRLVKGEEKPIEEPKKSHFTRSRKD